MNPAREIEGYRLDTRLYGDYCISPRAVCGHTTGEVRNAIEEVSFD